MEVMRTVYEALYKSIMQYGLIIWGGKQKSENKREFRAYGVSIKYTNKKFSQRLIDYLGPVMHNSLPLNIKKNVLIIPF